MNIDTDRYLVPFNGDGHAVRFFVFPHAASSCFTYFRALNRFMAGFECFGIEYPGHGVRAGVAFASDMSELAASIAREIDALPLKTFVFYGHSFGALVAYEVARMLERSGAVPPRVLAVSGQRAPTVPVRPPLFHELNEVELLAEVRKLNGTAASVLNDAVLLNSLVETLRADSRIGDSYVIDIAEPIDSILLAYSGAHDEYITADDLIDWRGATRRSCSVAILEGGHFFNLEGSAFFEMLRRDVIFGLGSWRNDAVRAG
jgi:medium-chain acyl-[acyl-carrier-protein] hydrolase